MLKRKVGGVHKFSGLSRVESPEPVPVEWFPTADPETQVIEQRPFPRSSTRGLRNLVSYPDRVTEGPSLVR